MRGRKLATIDEQEIRDAVAAAMPGLRADIGAVAQRLKAIEPYLLKAWMRTYAHDIGTHRYVGPA
jgi:hypothetical protein